MDERKYITLKDLDYGDLKDVIWDDIFADSNARGLFEFLLENGFLRVIIPKGTEIKSDTEDNLYTIKGEKFDLYFEDDDVRRIK